MKQVLIVDDAVTVRLYHRHLISELGYPTSEAENGVEALEKAMQTSFALMLVDVNMPKMDGYRFIEEVRKHPDLQSIPIIMISTESEAKDIHKAYSVGANFYLIKPTDPKRLQDLVTLILGQPKQEI